MTTRETDDSTPAPGSQRNHRRRPLIVEAVIAILAVALTQLFLVKPFGVPSESMENTLHEGDRILVNRLDHTVERLDVVVFGHGTSWAEAELPPAENVAVRIVRTIGDFTGVGPSNTSYTVKRVIGLPGEKVRCCDAQGRVMVDGIPLDEPYVHEDLPFTPGTSDCTNAPASPRCFPEITVPQDDYLVLGDHRSRSADSVIGCRGITSGGEGCAQFVPRQRIVGPVVNRFWPLNAFGALPR